jgi:nucleolar GTP-binding protein
LYTQSRGGDDDKSSRSQSMAAARSSSRGNSKAPRDEGMRDESMAKKARTTMKKSQTKMNRMAQIGEADRKYGPKLDKHLLAGKMGKGTSRSR